MIKPLQRLISAILVFPALALTACGPTTIIQKEKVLEKISPAPPGIQVDSFLYGVPYGKVDFLFVVDNTESGSVLIPDFKSRYVEFLNRMDSAQEAHQLDYRAQVVTASTGTSPDAFATSGQSAVDRQKHLDQLSKILETTETGVLNPFSSVATALQGQAYKARSHVPLFLVYWLGADVSADPGLQQAQSDLEVLLGASRGAFQTHAVLMGRQSRTTTDPARALTDSCKWTTPADLAATVLAPPASKRASFTTIDPCTPDWTSASSTLLNQVISFKKRLVLTQTPYEAQLMTVRSGAHVYRFGDDYHYDPSTNELVFEQSASLQPGDLLQASYFLQPGTSLLSGSPEPGAIAPTGTTVTTRK